MLRLTGKAASAFQRRLDGKPAKAVKRPKPSGNLFIAACRSHGLPEPEPEFPFCPGRRWRLDWAWPNHGKIAVEIQGAIFVGGRHVRGAALLKEYEKLNEAACRGWRIVFVTPQQVNDGSAFAWIERLLQRE